MKHIRAHNVGFLSEAWSDVSYNMRKEKLENDVRNDLKHYVWYFIDYGKPHPNSRITEYISDDANKVISMLKNRIENGDEELRSDIYETENYFDRIEFDNTDLADVVNLDDIARYYAKDFGYFDD